MIDVIEGISHERGNDVWKEGNPIPCYVSLYLILRSLGNVAYKLDLPSNLGSIHLVFHVLMLKKCVGGLSLVVPFKSVGTSFFLSYKKVSMEIFR